MFSFETAATVLMLIIGGIAAFSTLFIICSRLERDRQIERMVQDAHQLRDRQMARLAELRGQAPPSDEGDVFVVGETLDEAEELDADVELASAA